jgi:hypothetical protein
MIKMIFKSMLTAALWLSFLGFQNTVHAQSTQVNKSLIKGQFAVINGQKIYYERYGKGRPLVLLHGGINSIESSFKLQLEYFAAHLEIIAI